MLEIIHEVFRQSDGSASMWSLALCDGLKRLFMLAIVELNPYGIA